MSGAAPALAVSGLSSGYGEAVIVRDVTSTKNIAGNDKYMESDLCS